MPRLKSAQKALRQNKRRRAKNSKQQKAMKSLIKKFNRLIAAKQKPEASKMLPLAYKAVDKAAKNNLLKKNTASRKKSNLARALQQLS